MLKGGAFSQNFTSYGDPIETIFIAKTFAECVITKRSVNGNCYNWRFQNATFSWFIWDLEKYLLSGNLNRRFI